MKKITKLLFVGLFVMGCNPVTLEYSLIYTHEAPNEEFAEKLKEVLEGTYNVNIRLVEGNSVSEVIDSLGGQSIDMGLMENFTDEGEHINTVVPVYPKVLHLFHRDTLEPHNFEDLFRGRKVYIGREGTSSFNFMHDLFSFYEMDTSTMKLTSNMSDADVMALFSIVMSKDEISQYEGFKLFSFDEPGVLGNGSEVDGIALKFPRIRPFIIPKKTYGHLTNEPVVTISTDMMYVVREGMGNTAVNDLISTIFENRVRFAQLHSAFYYGIIENFDRSRLSYPLHEGARQYLDRDEPGFFERYAELAGVIFTITLAIGSGLVSLSKWRKQKKKDQVDVFYGDLMTIKQEIPQIRSVGQGREKIKIIRNQQSKAFEMLINEELEANESFRIYMELSRETIQDIQYRLRLIRAKQAQ